MMKTFALAASMMVLVAISGQALAARPHRPHRVIQAAANSQAMRAYNSVAPTTVDPHTHHYHGGPRGND